MEEGFMGQVLHRSTRMTEAVCQGQVGGPGSVIQITDGQEIGFLSLSLWIYFRNWRTIAFIGEPICRCPLQFRVNAVLPTVV